LKGGKKRGGIANGKEKIGRKGVGEKGSSSATKRAAPLAVCTKTSLGSTERSDKRIAGKERGRKGGGRGRKET